MVSWGAIAFIAFIILQRLSELVLARRNTQRLLARGGREVGANHYPLMVLLHTAWLVAIAVFGYAQPVSLFWLVLYAVLQLFRIWILASLGSRWTTRIILIDEPLVRRGPYKFIPHPNYALVVAEIAVTPMVLGLWPVALVFTILNALMLWLRISVEHEALYGAHSPKRPA